jgi:cyclic-di-GMP-binding protein
MAQQNSFDVVSKIDLAEVTNAINQTMKEVQQRFDFKGSKSEVILEAKENSIVLTSEDDFKLRNLNDILQQKLVKRGIPLIGLTYGKVEPAASSTVRQEISLQQGISTEKAKEIVKVIKDSKLKVQAAINGDLVRISGRDRDILQDVIKLLRSHDFGIHMEFTNYRSN